MTTFSRALVVFVVTLFLHVSPAGAQTYRDFVERSGDGTINWTSGTVIATGIGFPPEGVTDPARGRVMAERAAFVVALRNLLEVVKGVRVDGTTVVENYMVKSDMIQTQVSGFVKGARTVRRDVKPDGSVEVEVAVPMWGDNGLNLYLFDEKGVGKAPVEEAPSPEGYTSLVVDARGTGLTPTLFPTITDSEGHVIYSAEMVDKEEAARNGMAQFVTLKKGQTEGSLFFLLVADGKAPGGRKPLKLKGLSGSSSSKATIVISAEDAKKLSQSKDKTPDFLKRTRVLVILDPQMGGIEK